MHSRFRIVSTRDSDHKLLQMFSEAFDRLSHKDKANAPDVVVKES